MSQNRSRRCSYRPFALPNLARSPLAVAVTAVLYPVAATHAQSPSADPLEEVVVTATRREMNIQAVPQSVTALSTEFIEKQALTNLYDLVGALPSLNIVTTWPGQNTATSTIISEKAPARTSPGTMPARNRWPTDSSARKP